MCSFTDVVPESETETTPFDHSADFVSMPPIACVLVHELPEFPAFAHHSDFAAFLVVSSSCTAVDPEPESISEHACLSLFPSMSPLLPSHRRSLLVYQRPRAQHASSFSSAPLRPRAFVIPEPESVSSRSRLRSPRRHQAHAFARSTIPHIPAKVQLPEFASPVMSILLNHCQSSNPALAFRPWNPIRCSCRSAARSLARSVTPCGISEPVVHVSQV
jgi:hypothetical protein